MFDKDKGPCFGCEAPVRHEGCHGECIQYIDWNAERKAKKQFIAEQKRKEGEKRSYVKSVYERQMRRNGWKQKK